MSTPTPRTDAAWARVFALPEFSAARTPRTMRDECATLERELYAAEAALDQVACARTDGILRESDLQSMLNMERAKVRTLRCALQNLTDEQNDAPLETRRAHWQMAMDEAGLALAATEDAK